MDVTTEMLMRRAIERGLTAADLENMTIGMVLDFLVEYKNEEMDAQEMKKQGVARYATQEDVDAF